VYVFLCLQKKTPDELQFIVEKICKLSICKMRDTSILRVHYYDSVGDDDNDDPVYALLMNRFELNLVYEILIKNENYYCLFGNVTLCNWYIGIIGA
jgi:hypothetical protein